MDRLAVHISESLPAIQPCTQAAHQFFVSALGQGTAWRDEGRKRENTRWPCRTKHRSGQFIERFKWFKLSRYSTQSGLQHCRALNMWQIKVCLMIRFKICDVFRSVRISFCDAASHLHATNLALKSLDWRTLRAIQWLPTVSHSADTEHSWPTQKTPAQALYRRTKLLVTC